MTLSWHRISVFYLAAAVIGAVVAGVFSGAAYAASSKPVTVIELFTSQGCSSCPPADKLLRKYSRRKDIIALTFNVDYWDYLGWKDTLASPANSARQRSYARARGDGQVYTPQAVINGVRHVVGSYEADIERAIARAKSSRRHQAIPLKMWSEGDTLVIRAGAASKGVKVKPATIWLALVQKKKTVAIKRGENSGRKITYYSVVRELTPVGRWNGQEVTVKLPKHHLKSGGADGCTVLLQVDMAGPILAAAEMKDW